MKFEFNPDIIDHPYLADRKSPLNDDGEYSIEINPNITLLDEIAKDAMKSLILPLTNISGENRIKAVKKIAPVAYEFAVLMLKERQKVLTKLEKGE